MKKLRIARGRNGLLISVACLFSVSAHAVDKEYLYIGGGVGSPMLDYESQNVGGGSTDDAGQSWSVLVAYQPIKHFTIEASYNYFGKSDFLQSGSAISNGAPIYSTTQGNLKSSGIGALGIASMNAGKFDFFFKAGVLYSETSVSATRLLTSTPPGSPTISQTIVIDESDQNTGLMFAVGAGYTVAERFNINVTYTMAPDGIKVENVLEGDAAMINLGFKYRFAIK